MSERCLHSGPRECVVRRTSWNVGSLYTLSDGHYNEIYELEEIGSLVSNLQCVVLFHVALYRPHSVVASCTYAGLKMRRINLRLNDLNCFWQDEIST